MDPLSIARYGMMSAQDRLTRSAERSAGQGGDPVHETVEQAQAALAFQANAQVVRMADQMWRALLDVQKT